MTKAERTKLARAVRLIHSDEDNGGDYTAGMDLLMELLGRGRPGAALKRRSRKVDAVAALVRLRRLARGK